MSAAYDFVLHVGAMVPVFTAPPGINGHEFIRPLGWQRLDLAGNIDRLHRHEPGHAVMGVMGGPVAVVDVDVRNGGDPDRTRQLLDALGVRVFADVLTAGGGRHFYIAGHPDLPTVHATRDREAFSGHAGVEVISFGANIYLPGTTRPKYDGAGYVILDDNLQALEDGGDPDGADTFAGWVADNRATKSTEFTMADAWTGDPP